MRFSPEVLPVVGVITLGLVVFFVEGTPLSLEIEHVEISILSHQMDYSCFDITDGVSE
jgi:hypothetical protein